MGSCHSDQKTAWEYIHTLFVIAHDMAAAHRHTGVAPLKQINKLIQQAIMDKQAEMRLARKQDILGERPPDTLKGPPCTDLELLESILHDIPLAGCSYDLKKKATCCSPPRFDVNAICKETGLSREDFIFMDPSDTLKSRPTLVAIDKANKRVVVSICGTQSIKDAIVDAVSAGMVVAPSIAAHKAVFNSAIETLSKVRDVTLKALDGTGYAVVFMGHSLGAGIAALCAWEVKNMSTEEGKAWGRVVGSKVTALCYCCPPVLTMDAAHDAEGYITSIGLGRDPVVRAAVVNAWLLLSALKDGKGSSGSQDGGLPVKLPAPADDQNYDVNSHSVPTHVPVGKDVIYPMFTPGRLLHIVPVKATAKAADVEAVEKEIEGIDPLATRTKKIGCLPAFNLNMKSAPSAAQFDRAASQWELGYEVVTQADGKDRWSLIRIEPVRVSEHLLTTMEPVLGGIVRKLKQKQGGELSKSTEPASNAGGGGVSGAVFPGSNKVHPET